YLVVFFVGQLYEVERRYRESHSFFHICVLVATAFVIIATLYYAIPYWRIARRVMAIQAPIVAGLIYLWPSGYDICSPPFVAPRHILLVGAGETARSLIQDIHAGYGGEFRIAGIIHEDPSLHGTDLEGVPILGDSRKLAEIAAAEGIEAIVFSSGYHSAADGN